MGCLEDNSTDMENCGLFDRFASLISIVLIIAIVILALIYCLCIKISDLKLRACVTRMAKKKSVKLDLDKLDANQTRKNSPSSHLNENCTIVVPDVAIVL